MKLKITLLLLACFYSGFAQVTNQGKPLSWKIENLETVKPITMPAFDLAALQAEDKANENRKDIPWRFGYEFFVDHNLTNSGKWHTLPSGDRIWRIRYKSEGAKTLNFLFSDYYMPAGAKVYLYNNAHTDLLGAYDARQNNEQRVLGTWLVKGQDIWIEYFEPAAVAGQGKLEIFKVVHGYRTQDEGLTKAPDDDLNGSGDCNVDVDCFIDDIEQFKEINKKAVGLIITNNSSFCSGGLVNNTANDGTPYFLTANHCYSDPAQWAFRFNWISPNPVCAGTQDSTTNAPDYYQTLSGATLRARRTESDFCLVEITADIPSEWDLIFAGWDRSSTAPESVFGIHHPAGDIMKACRDYGPLTTEENMWRIEDWDIGVTEGGSSGSPIYDNFGYLRGQLYGGNSACTGTTDNGQYDVYGRFDVSWSAGTTAATRLSDWLDPLNTGAMTLEYYPPVEVYALDARAVISTLGQDVCGHTVAPVLRLNNRGTNTLTTATLSYVLNNAEPVVIDWAGNLATNEYEDIQLDVLEGITGQNNFTFTVTNPNNGTDDFENNNTATKDFEVEEVPVYTVGNVVFDFVSDDYPYETSWQITDEAGTVLYDQDIYWSFNPVTDNQTFELTAGCYIFTMNDDAGDGICCEYGEGNFSLITEAGDVIFEGGEFGSSVTVKFKLEETAAVKNSAFKNAVKIYPNPSAGIYNITVAGAYQNLDYQMYNVMGQKINSGKMTNGSTINISNAANGVYMLKVTEQSTGKEATFKLVKE
ncbi:T9SS type A sorting domain-containing protein [Flavobacterium sp. Sd200]|uniref:T9SS type A sorting domain-containing protein n=1 Tax=Flavobacterium sp. Sd200 TaxID=2692211 RepID=UPI00136B0DFC|nr:T9SS type A sorting domain-containing protein [Flavobacterium sp. Sd200]MXN92819.1 T9SS type A sorting domain-containing protein [Flavobacterium sp. Sd200]